MNTKETIDAILAETGKAVLGKDDVLRRILTAILAGGHILIDDIPGVGKTTMAVAFTRTLGLDYKRMQFTPDVLPSDITGFSMYDKASDSFRYVAGSAMTNFVVQKSSGSSPSSIRRSIVTVAEVSSTSRSVSTIETASFPPRCFSSPVRQR